MRLSPLPPRPRPGDDGVWLFFTLIAAIAAVLAVLVWLAL